MIITSWKKSTAASVAIVAALTLGGCAPGSAGEDAKAQLTLGSAVAPTSFDPAAAQWNTRAPFYQAVYDTLLLATSEGKIEPFLAKSFEYNADRTELTLELRDDVKFADGSELSAEVVVANLKRFQEGTSPDAKVLAGITFAASGNYTVVLQLKEPDPALLLSLSRNAGLVASNAALADPKTLASAPVGSGPYVLDQAATVSGSEYVFTKNADYWNPSVQHYDKLVIKQLADPTAALNALKAGEINAVRLANNDDLAEVEASGWTLQHNNYDVQGLALLDRAGTMNKAIGDVRVRQAINHAIDRDGLLQALQGGNGELTEQMFPERSGGYDAKLDERYSFDLERARELMAEAGYANGFTLAMPTSPTFGNTLFTLIEGQLKEIGITVQYADAGTNFISDVLAPKYAATYISLGQDDDWPLINNILAPAAPFNPFKYADPAADSLIVKIRTADPASSAKLAHELNEHIVEQAWFAPFFRRDINVATDANTTVEPFPSSAVPPLYAFKPKG